MLLVLLLSNLKLLIIFVHTPNSLRYVVLSYHVLVTTPHLRLFVHFSVLMCFFLQCLPVICLYVVFVHNVITCIYTVLCL
jgi:hypothetical protein